MIYPLGSAAGAVMLLMLGTHAFAIDSDRLDMNAADSTVNAPYLIDSRFVVQASRLCAASSRQSRDAMRSSGRAEVKRLAREAILNCKQLSLKLASLQREKGWTLPPPDSMRYGPIPLDYSDSGYIANQAADYKAILALFNGEAIAGRDEAVKALAKRESSPLQRAADSLYALQ